MRAKTLALASTSPKLLFKFYALARQTDTRRNNSLGFCVVIYNEFQLSVDKFPLAFIPALISLRGTSEAIVWP